MIIRRPQDGWVPRIRWAQSHTSVFASAPNDGSVKGARSNRVHNTGGLADPEGFEPSTAGLEIRSPIRARRRVRIGHGKSLLRIHRPRLQIENTARGVPVKETASAHHPLNPRMPLAVFAALAAFTAALATSRTAM